MKELMSQCSTTSCVFMCRFVYGMGMIAYVLKPEIGGWDFGGHEMFHVFVMAGHCSILMVDLLL